MYFLIDNELLIKKYNKIWNRVSNSMKKKNDSKPIKNKIFLKTKIKYYGDEGTDF